MKKMSEIVKEGIYKIEKEEQRLFRAACSPEMFRNVFFTAATKKLFFKESTFIVDANNKNIIIQLYHYLTGSTVFTGNLHKGILLTGIIGNGKTILMESFIEVLNESSNKIITSIHAKDIIRYIIDQNIGYLYKRPLYIDDIGKESEQASIFGTKVYPFEDLIDQRYRNRGLTFGTTNFTIEDLPYTKHVKDRLREMFNIIVLPGESRRK